MGEVSGITTVAFTGTATSTTTDANTSNLPLGGVLLSIGSTEGFGYQPLVSAGATAKVTNVGVLTDVAIGSTGSGYRTAEQYEFLVKTNEFVGIGSTEIFIPNTGSVLDLLPQLNTGTNCKIEFGRIFKNEEFHMIHYGYAEGTLQESMRYARTTPMTCLLYLLEFSEHCL